MIEKRSKTAVSMLFSGRVMMSLPVLPALVLAGCGSKEPTGQVLAVVNGQEVTRSEMSYEAQETAGVSQVDVQQMLPAMMDNVVSRKVAAQEAERLDLDEQPQFIAKLARVKEALLAQALFDRWMQNAKTPGNQEINAFIAANPQMFAGRKLLLIDRIEAPLEGIDLRGIEPLKTNDEVEAYLKDNNIPHRRVRSAVDSGQIPKVLYEHTQKSPPGYPLAFAGGKNLVVMALVDSRDTPTPNKDVKGFATTVLKRKVVEQKMAALKGKAEIEYQVGYKPVPKNSSEPKPLSLDK